MATDTTVQPSLLPQTTVLPDDAETGNEIGHYSSSTNGMQFQPPETTKASANVTAAATTAQADSPDKHAEVAPVAANGAGAYEVKVRSGEALSVAVNRFAHEQGITYKQALEIVKFSNQQFDWTKVDGNLHSKGLTGRDADLVHAGDVIKFDKAQVDSAKNQGAANRQQPANTIAPAAANTEASSPEQAQENPAAAKTATTTAAAIAPKANPNGSDEATLQSILAGKAVGTKDFEALILHRPDASEQLNGKAVKLTGSVTNARPGLVSLADSGNSSTIHFYGYHGQIPAIGSATTVEGRYDAGSTIALSGNTNGHRHQSIASIELRDSRPAST